jgi:site-specific DNA-methyltransferase (adenine-specific)
MLAHGVGAININGTRIGGDGHSEHGRWPANLLLSHAPDCHGLTGETTTARACAPGCPVKALDDQACADGFGGEAGVSQYFHTADWRNELPIEAVLTGTRSAAHYCPKPSVAERDAGLAEPGASASTRQAKHVRTKALRGRQKAFAPRDTKTRLNPHTTVKPAGAMQWLVTLVTPPGGTVLDPFCGSGSTGFAVGLANANPHQAPGWSFIGIEADFDNAGFVETARKRIRHGAGTSMVEVSDEASVLAA